MFEPKYTITEGILTNVVKFEVVRAMVNSVEIAEEWENKLKIEALVKRIFFFSKLLGCGLNETTVEKIVSGDPERDEKAGEVAFRLGIVGKEKEIQQVINIINTYRYANHLILLSRKFRETEVGEKELRQLNTILGEKIFKSEYLGVYRLKEAVGEKFSFVPAVEVPYLLEDVLVWTKNLEKGERNNLLNYGVVLYELVRILPFENNALGTVLEFVRTVMSIAGYSLKELWYLEEEILKNENSFWLAMASVEKNNWDMTEYLEFFTKSLADGGERLKTRLVNLVGELPKFRTEGGKVVALSERQIALMEEITVRREMTIKELRSVLSAVSDDTILRDLKDLLAKKMIKKRGKTKGATYVLGKIKSFK